MKIIAGIVTYNPDIQRLTDNINSIDTQVHQIVIVDNNSHNLLEIKKIIKKNIKIIENKENYGIAKALNQLMEYAKKNGIEWVLTLDQDSICPPKYVESLSENIKENIAIVCPKVYDLNKKNIIKNSNNNKQGLVDKCITSGSLTSVKAWERVGKYDEKMFIDGVDFEFCYRIRAYKYYIYRDSSIELIHEIGHISIKKFLLWNIVVLNHSAFRKYYIARNIIYFAKKTQKPKYIIKSIFQEIKLIGIVLLYEDDKKNKIRRIAKGIQDGIKS